MDLPLEHDIQEHGIAVEDTIFAADAMLVYGLVAGGHCDVSNGALNFLFRLLTLPTFKTAVTLGQVSKSLHEFYALQCSAPRWQEVSMRGNTFYVRSMKSILAEVLADKVLVSIRVGTW